MQLGELAHGFFVKGLCVWRFVEVEITAEHLVGTLAAQYHLDAHALDDAGQQVHRSGGAHGGHIIGFYVIDHVADGVESLLNGVVDFMMYGSDMIGHLAGLGQIGGSLQTHGE